MYTLILENKYGDKLELTHNPNYTISMIDGLDPPDATINTTHNAGFDGSTFNSAYVNNRTITITLAVNQPAEENRIALYRYSMPKASVRVYYRNGTRDVYIDGYVQTMPIGYFDRKQVVQIVILCPQPLYTGTYAETQEMTSVDALMEFEVETPAVGIEFSEIILNQEKSITNNGDIETGAVITIRATGAAETPKIYNTGTGEYIILNVTMAAGDVIVINTRKGEKKIVLTHSGTDTNIVGLLEQGSTWFSLLPGDNVFIYTADTNPENLYLTFDVLNQYQGV